MLVWSNSTTRWAVSQLSGNIIEPSADWVAMEPDEAAPILTKFADGLNMEMTGKFWAPSKSSPLSIDTCNCSLTLSDGARGIGNAEEVMGKEWTSKPGPLELPW